MGLFYKLQLCSEYLYKLWRSFNEFQQQDYLYLVRYKLINEMIILYLMGLTHGDLKNEGTENFHSLENLIFERGLSKGEKDEKKICQNVLLHIWEFTLLRIDSLSKLILDNEGKEVDLYIKGGWKKKDSKKIAVTENIVGVVLKISELVQSYTGKNSLFELETNYEKKPYTNKQTNITKTKYCLKII